MRKEAAVVSEFVHVHVIYNLRNFSKVQLQYYVVLETHRYRLSALQVEGDGWVLWRGVEDQNLLSVFSKFRP